MVSTRKRSYSSKLDGNDAAKPANEKRAEALSGHQRQPETGAHPRKKKSKPKLKEASNLAYGSSTSSSKEKSSREPFLSMEQLIIIAALVALLMVFVAQRVAPQGKPETETNCRRAWSVASGDGYLKEVSKKFPSIAEVNKADYASFADTMRSFALDLTYDWEETALSSLLDQPQKHAVSARVEGSDPAVVYDVLETYLRRSLGDKCYSKSVAVVDIGEVEGGTSSGLRDVINSHLKSKRSDPGLLRIVVIRNSDKGKGLMQLKSHLDAEEIVVNETTGTQVSSRGVGFIFASATLPSDVECKSTDTLIMDETVNGWRRSFLGRITYRARIC